MLQQQPVRSSRRLWGDWALWDPGQGRNWGGTLASYRQRVGREKYCPRWSKMGGLSIKVSAQGLRKRFIPIASCLPEVPPLLFHHENHSHRHITKSTCKNRNDSNVQFSRAHLKKKTVESRLSVNWVTPYTEYLSYGHIRARTRRLRDAKGSSDEAQSNPQSRLHGTPRRAEAETPPPAPRRTLDLWVGPKAARVSRPDSENRSGIITHLIKTLQMAHIKTKSLKKFDNSLQKEEACRSKCELGAATSPSFLLVFSRFSSFLPSTGNPASRSGAERSSCSLLVGTDRPLSGPTLPWSSRTRCERVLLSWTAMDSILWGLRDILKTQLDAGGLPRFCEHGVPTVRYLYRLHSLREIGE